MKSWSGSWVLEAVSLTLGHIRNRRLFDFASEIPHTMAICILELSRRSQFHNVSLQNHIRSDWVIILKSNNQCSKFEHICNIFLLAYIVLGAISIENLDYFLKDGNKLKNMRNTWMTLDSFHQHPQCVRSTCSIYCFKNSQIMRFLIAMLGRVVLFFFFFVRRKTHHMCPDKFQLLIFHSTLQN